MVKRKEKVVWDADEIALVATKIANLIILHPELPDVELIGRAQEAIPAQRRRQLSGFSQSAPLLAEVKRQLLLVSKSNQAELRQLKEDLAAVRAQNAELSKRQLEPEQVLTTTSIELLLKVLLGRLVAGISSEREKLAQIEVRLGEERNALDQRLFSIEGALNNLRGKPHEMPQVPTVATPADDYMPKIIMAGGTRQDFQKIQPHMHRTRIRLERLNTDRPVNQVTIPKCDRLIIWDRGLTGHLMDTIKRLVPPTKLQICNGAEVELVSLLLCEANEVRKQRNNNGQAVG